MLQQSLSRPAWTHEDWYAFRHKHTIIRGKPVRLYNYYVKLKGQK